jgi:hypothetical protein
MYSLTITDQESEFLQTILVEFEQNDPSERIDLRELLFTQHTLPKVESEGDNLNVDDKQIRFLESVVFNFLQKDPNQTMSPTETALARGLFDKITAAIRTESSQQPPDPPSTIFQVYSGPGPYMGDNDEDPLGDPMSPGAFMS